MQEAASFPMDRHGVVLAIGHEVRLVVTDLELRFLDESEQYLSVRDGSDVLFISTGFMTMRVLEAAKRLQKDSVDCAVLHVPTIKPLSVKSLVSSATRASPKSRILARSP